MLLCSNEDSNYGWLRTGEALERIWLALTRKGFQAGPLTQVIEVGFTREQLQRLIGLPTYPQLLLRIGRAPADLPASPRRSAAEVITDRLPEPASVAAEQTP